MLIAIAGILFATTAANHLGLIAAIEETIRHKLPVVNCSKCFCFWVTLAYCLYNRIGVGMFAIAFLNAYLTIWLELGMGYIDILYNKVYDTLYDTTDNKIAANGNEGSSDNSLPELHESRGETDKKEQK